MFLDVNAAQEKLERYRKEADLARSLQQKLSWRSLSATLAGKLTELKPPPKEGRQLKTS